MNILYIGPYRQANDGWANASLNFLLSLLETKHNISCRPIYLANSTVENIPFEILSHEINLEDNYDVCIQQVLPPYFEYNGNFKRNIGMCFTETGKLQNTNWIQKINLMDELIVASKVEKLNLAKSGVTIPIYVLPIPCNVDKFNKKPQNLFDKEGQFLFYYVGEYIQRKNIVALLMAFHLEFNSHENINLLLKVNRNGTNPIDLRNMVQRDISELKKNMRLYPKETDYKNEIIITDFLSDEQIDSLHQTCDCFVCPSHGEAFSIPTFEALGWGKTPIITEYTGMQEFINCENGYIVESVKSPVYTIDIPFPELYTSRETWESPMIKSLQVRMRDVYNNRNTNQNMIEQGKNSIINYSHKNIAEKLQLILGEDNGEN